MLNLYGANRFYTDIELLDKAAKYIFANGLQDDRLDDAIDMLSKILDYDADFINGYVKKSIQELTTA